MNEENVIVKSIEHRVKNIKELIGMMPTKYIVVKRVCEQILFQCSCIEEIIGEEVKKC